MLIRDTIEFGLKLRDNIYEYWESGGVLVGLMKALGGLIFGIIMGLQTYIVTVMILMFISFFSEWKAYKNTGKIWSCRKTKNNTIDKFILYGLLALITLCIDFMLRGGFFYEKYYITMLITTLIGLYEANISVGYLKVAYPDHKILETLSRILNILETKVEEKTVNQAEKMIDEITDIHNDITNNK